MTAPDDSVRLDEPSERGNALVSPLSARERAKEEKALKKARAAAIAALRYADDCLDSEDVAFALSRICDLYGHPLSDEEKVKWGLLDETVVGDDDAEERGRASAEHMSVATFVPAGGGRGF